MLHSSHQHTTLLNCYTKYISSNTKPLNPGSTDGPTELITVLVSSFWFRPAWSRELVQLWTRAAESSPVVLCATPAAETCRSSPEPSQLQKGTCILSNREPSHLYKCIQNISAPKSPRKEKSTRNYTERQGRDAELQD